MSFQEGHWGLCKEARWVKGLAESILSSYGTLLAWDKVFPALSQQVSKTQRLTLPTGDVGSSMAASFTDLAQSSGTALSLQKLTLASQGPISSFQQ